MGSPSRMNQGPAALGPEGRVRTSRRMSAKRKWQDAMFRVYTAGRRHAQEPVNSATHERCGIRPRASCSRIRRRRACRSRRTNAGGLGTPRGPPGLERAGPRAEEAGGDTFSTVMPWRRVMRRARFKNRRGCLGPGACDPSGISDMRPVSWSGRKPSAVHATGALYRPPTSLVKSSPTWIDASRT